MNRLLAAALPFAGGILASCATAGATPTAPAQPAVAPSPASEVPVRDVPVSEVVVKAPLPAYICPDGQRVELDHDAPAGVMRASRSGVQFVLQQQVSTDGSQRFVQDQDTLERFAGEIHLKRGSETRQVCPAVPAAPERGAIWGTITKLDRMALPEGTLARVLLIDAARADAPYVEIASTTIRTTGYQVPLHYLIRYPVERVAPRPLTYRVHVRIELPNGELGWITDTATMVLETDAPQPPVDLQVVRVGAPS